MYSLTWLVDVLDRAVLNYGETIWLGAVMQKKHCGETIRETA